MSSVVSFGTNTNAQRKRVYYTGSDTVYEGMALCYDQDTTTNVLHYDKGTGSGSSTPTTTAEGNQNEGKFLHVEKPATANLAWFAGVVAHGPKVGSTGPCWLDVFVPNGAIVPVRSYISSTVATNAMAIQNGQYYLGDPAASTTNGAARYVAIAMETVNRSSVAGICLAKLCPDQFMYQSYGSSKLEFVETATVDIAANFINVHSSQASGGFTALWVRSEVDTAGNSDHALGIYGEVNVLGVCSSTRCIGHRFSLNLWGGTQTAGKIHALTTEIYEQDANLGSIEGIGPLWLTDMVDSTNAPPANTHYMIFCEVNGDDKPDGLLYAHTADAIGFTTCTDTPTKGIPIRVAGTTYWIAVCEAQT